MGFFDFSIHFLCSIFSLARNLCKSIEKAKWTKVNERLFTLIESVFRCVMRLHEKIWMNRMQIDNIYHILRAWNTSIEFNFLLEFKFFGTTKLRLKRHFRRISYSFHLCLIVSLVLILFMCGVLWRDTKITESKERKKGREWANELNLFYFTDMEID